MLDIKIRLEEPRDYNEVESVARQAFYRINRVSKIGVGCVEHYMIHMLREHDGIKGLSFVAIVNDKIVGHVIYSHSYIIQDDGSKISTLNAGPLSVLPIYQKQGIVSKLMRHSINCARDMGYGAILFFGHATYYPRFRFVEAKDFGITTAWGDNFPSFMAMELKKDYLLNVSGKYIESELYDEDLTKESAKSYDEQFMNGEINNL